MADHERTKEQPTLVVEVEYEPATLIAAAASFDTTSELMAGALYGVTDPITRATAKKRLAKFLNKEVHS